MNSRTQRWLGALAGLLIVPMAAGCQGEQGEPGETEMAAMELNVARTLTELRTPESARPGPDGRYYVSEIGEFGTDGDGRILAFDPMSWESSVFADGLNDPKGIAFVEDVLYVTDRDRIVGLTAEGQGTVIPADAFPAAPTFLNDLVAGPHGMLYVSDSGEFEASDGAIYMVDAMAGEVQTVISSDESPLIESPNGLAFGPEGTLYTVDLKSGNLLAVGDGSVYVAADGFGGGDGLEFGPDGWLYVSDVRNGRVFRVQLTEAGASVQQVASVASSADLGLDAERGRLLIPQLSENTLTVLELP